MNKYSQYSLINFLLEKMPGLLKNKPVNNECAADLYKMWMTKEAMVSGQEFKKTEVISKLNIEGMVKEGLVRQVGERIQVTAKGVDVIKNMVLGDDRSSFEDDGSILTYKEAKENTKIKKTSRKNYSAWLENYFK